MDKVLLTYAVLVYFSQATWSQQAANPINNGLPSGYPTADIVLTQDYGSNWNPDNPNVGSIEEYRPAPGTVDSAVIDGTQAFWVFQNNGQYPRDPTVADPADRGSALRQTYPIQLYQQNGTFFRGASIQGYISLTSAWEPTYLNGTGFLVRQSHDVTVENVRADRVWDAVRSSRSDNTTFRNCWLSRIRDDAVENDHLRSLTLENILFEDSFVGISMRPVRGDTTSSGAGNLVTMDGVHLYLSPYWYDATRTHDTGQLFKTSGDYVMPKMLIKNCVFGWEVDPAVHKPDNITHILADVHPESGNNTALWMSLEPVPDWFYDEAVLPAALFTHKLVGQAAIDFADSDKAAFKTQWIAADRPTIPAQEKQAENVSIRSAQRRTGVPTVSITQPWQVFPNPFTETVEYTYQLAQAEAVTVELYTPSGRKLRTLKKGEVQRAGQYHGRIDTRHLEAGVYLLRIGSSDDYQIKKLIKK